MKNTVRSKLPDLPVSIFTLMNNKARQYNALNLAQGFPDFDTDPRLVELVTKAMRDGYNQYAPMEGLYSLREAIAEKIEAVHGVQYDPDTSITVTSGATQALYTAIAAFVYPGDEVIVFKPAYDCYEPSVIANGGVVRTLQMSGKDYRINWEAFRGLLNPKTRMVVINTPHNPSGTVFDTADMEALQEHLRGTGILVLSDEVYEHLVYDGEQHQSACRFPDLASRSLICSSFGKTFHTTGWKMGYCAAPAELMKEFRKIHEFNVFCVNHAIQKALAAYLKDPSHYLELPEFFQAKRDVFLSALAASRFRFSPCKGTYFQLLEYGHFSEEGDVAFAERLAKDHGITGIPISVFNHNALDHRQIRFCFGKKDETLKKACEILQRV